MKKKTETLPMIRVTPETKAWLKSQAEKDSRSLSAYLRLLIERIVKQEN